MQFSHLLFQSYGEMSLYTETNYKGEGLTCNGTRAMLQDWYERTSGDNCIAILYKALIDSKLHQLADKFKLNLLVVV